MPNSAPGSTPPTADTASYIVVARRYRPQSFDELIGQEHVSQALSNAIATHRVGHAYLFTGARGTGKTSTARILAKALNCVNGPTATPCNQCDICRSISGGDDVDVLEIDGASNRGIDEIRQLRQNVNVRPGRARYKIYIIDEVHMLTREAFNALLKTLEEPPEHVKFIFCTTEATKIPITILSRCQRFDFAGISTRSIVGRLEQIVKGEGVAAESESLELIARRAAGSMRDSQSLLEQLLAFAPERITVADVHEMLGTAGDQRLANLVQHLVDRNAAGALAELDTAAKEGVDVALLVEQLFGYLRDCMVAAVGCPAESLLYCSPSASTGVAEAGRRLGLHTILAAMQILDQTLARMRQSTQARILAELALVRLSQLEELDELANWIALYQAGQLPGGQLSIGQPGAGTAAAGRGAEPSPSRSAPPPRPAPGASALKKNTEVIPGPSGLPSDTPGAAVVSLSAANASEVWNQALDRMKGMVVDQARQCSRVEAKGPNRLAVFFSPMYVMAKSTCQYPENLSRFEQALADVAGQTIRVEFHVTEEAAEGPEKPAARVVSQQQRLMDAAKHPMVRRAVELFGAHPTSVEEG